MDDGTAFVIGVVATFFVTAIMLYNLGWYADIPAKTFASATAVCEVNGGIKSLDHYTATCMNGGRFAIQ